jgi:tetratricopeptide (TPR) repeat protein
MNQLVPAVSVAAPDGNRAKVFISYSRKDKAFAEMLVGALGERGFDNHLDKADIATGEDWQKRIAELIAAADTVVFAVSPDSIASKICAWELEESVRLGKRLIPVVARPIPDADVPPALGRLNWLFCTEDDNRDAALATLNMALNADLAWEREHTRLGDLARRWNEQGRRKGATVRGADLDAAERWLDRRPADANAPTDLHQAFIRESRRATTSRQRYWVGGSLGIALAAISLAGYAEINRREAQAQRDRAERTLTLATGTANGLVFDLAQKFRNVIGVPVTTIKGILDQARQLQDQLLGAGESNPGLRRSQAEALLETAGTFLALGDTQSAFTTAKQAQELFQALLEQQPDSTDFLHELSASYDRTGDVQNAMGNLPDALTSYQAGLAIDERLTKSEPGNARWQRGLSVSYNHVGDVQVKQGNLPGALTSFQASLAITERLTKSDSGNAGWQRDLSASYIKVGNVQMAQGNLSDAMSSYQASLTIPERLAKSDPGDAVWQQILSMSYIKIGDVQMAQDKLPAALTSYRASFAIDERLAKSDPDVAAWQADLSVSYNKVGDVQAAQGNLPEALSSFQASLAIFDRLAKSDPGNVRWQYNLSVSHDRIGDAQFRQGYLPEALTSYQAGLAIADRLARSDPGNAGWQHGLSVSHNHVGDVQVKQDNLPEALASYQASLAILGRLAAADPGNAVWRHDLSYSYGKISEVSGSYEKLGDLQVKQGNLPGALASYQAEQAIFEDLAKSDPDNTDWQHDLAASYARVGELQVAQGNLPDALTSYQAGLAILDRQAKSNPGNTSSQSNLGWLHGRIGDAQVKLRNLPAALTSFQQGLMIKDLLAKSDPDNTDRQRDLSYAYNEVGGVQVAQGNLPEALDTYRHSLAIVRALVANSASNTQWQSDLDFVINQIGYLAPRFVLAGNFSKALEVADQAIALAPSKAWLDVNRAHALMFLGRTDEARALYQAHRGETIPENADKLWQRVISEDFAVLRKSGLANPLMDEIEKQFAADATPQSPPRGEKE